MKVFEMAKEIEASNAELLELLRDSGYEIKSHLSTLTDEQIALIKSTVIVKEEKNEEKTTVSETIERVSAPHKFVSGDMIPCRCVRPNKVIYYSSKTQSRYEWNGYGDICEVDYSDLLSMKSSKDSTMYQPKILIEDERLYEQWSSILEKPYSSFAGLTNPEDLFTLSDKEFEEGLLKSPPAIQSLVKIVASRLIRNKQFESLNKLTIMDNILKTDFKEFI